MEIHWLKKLRKKLYEKAAAEGLAFVQGKGQRKAPLQKSMEEKINSELGKLLRVNRSVQAEGVFAMVKEDMNFRRFLLRGMVKIQVEWTLLSLAYNLLKLHHKAKTDRLGTGLIMPKQFPAGL